MSIYIYIYIAIYIYIYIYQTRIHLPASIPVLVVFPLAGCPLLLAVSFAHSKMRNNQAMTVAEPHVDCKCYCPSKLF